MSLKKILYNELKTFRLLSRSYLRNFGERNGYDIENTGRQLRALSEEEKIYPLTLDKETGILREPKNKREYIHSYTINKPNKQMKLI